MLTTEQKQEIARSVAECTAFSFQETWCIVVSLDTTHLTLQETLLITQYVCNLCHVVGFYPAGIVALINTSLENRHYAPKESPDKPTSTD